MAYALGAVAPFVADVAETVGPMFGVANIGGWRASAADMSGHPAGLALDFQTGGEGAGRLTGDKVAAYFVQNASRLHVKYVIWQQRIWKPSAPTWTLMETRPGDKPGYDPNHLRHVHVSFTEDVKDGRRLSGGAPPKPDDGTEWWKLLLGPIPAAVGMIGSPSIPNPLAPAAEAVRVLTDRSTWTRVFQVVVGTVMVGAGIAILSRDVLGPAVSMVAGAVPQGRAAKVVAGVAAATSSGGK